MSHQVGPVAIMIICKDIKLSSTMLRKNFQRCCKENDQMSTGGVYNTILKNWQILTTRNSALRSYEQETDNSSNLEVLDNLNYVRVRTVTLEIRVELQC